jgi:P4 family phage/plasmid primase-like protien
MRNGDAVLAYPGDEDYPDEADPAAILQRARSVEDRLERAKLAGTFLETILGEPSTVQDVWLDKAKGAFDTTKKALRRDLAGLRKERRAEVPNQRELHDRWLDAHPQTRRSVYWRRYRDGWWPVVPDEQVKREVKAIVEDAEGEGVELTAYLVNQVNELVGIERYTDAETWDAETSLLVCKNGTLNLETRELLEHDPEHYATSAVDYEYDPAADCPTFQYVIRSTMAHAEAFLQEFAGYCLTTDTSHETALWLHGEPGGGKSTVLEGLETMLGERCGTLGIARIEKSRFGLAAILGKTLLIASDQPAGYITASNILNNLISGETLQVERKFRDAVDVRPKAKIAWSMNDLPTVKGGGTSGLFRRVEVVKCGTVPESERDPEVKELVRQEAAGILNWALDGLERLRKQGHFTVTDEMQRASDDFQRLNDKARMFVEEQLERDADKRVASGRLYGAYKAWCEQNGYRARARQKMRSEWERLGLEHKKKAAGIFYYGAGFPEQ